MGEHKHKNNGGFVRGLNPEEIRRSAMVVTDLEDVARVLADEQMYCEQCAAALPLWPPEGIRDHTIKVHPTTVWPALEQAWKAYETDTDLARRENFRNKLRVEFVVSMLAHRCDLYEKLVEAGVIRAPAQG